MSWYKAPPGQFGQRPVPHLEELQSHFPFRDLLNRFLVDVYGCVHSFSMIDAPAADVQSAEHLNELQKVLSDVLSVLPTDILQVQYNFIRNGDYAEFISHHLACVAAYPMAGELRSLRGERLLKQMQKRQISRDTTVLVLTCGPQVESKESNAIARQFEQHASSKRLPCRLLRENEFKEAVSTLRGAEIQFTDLVRGVGIRLAPVSAYGVASFYYRLFNPDLALDLGIPLQWDPEADSFFSAFLQSEVEVRESCLQWGDYFHTLVSLSEEPHQSQPRDIERWTTLLPFADFRVTLSLRRTEKEQMMRRASARRRSAIGKIKLGMDPLEGSKPGSGQGDGMGRYLAEEMDEVEAANEVLVGLKNNKIYIAHSQMVFHLWHRERTELMRRRDLLLARIADLNRAKGFREVHSLYWTFFNSLPAAYAPFLRPRELKDRMAADLVPLHKAFEGSGKPVILLRNNRNGLVGFDLFDRSEVPNSLTFVSGASGSGKSVLVNLLIEQSMVLHPETKKRPLLIILDVGGSYRHLVETVLRGRYIEFNPDQPICLSPLHLVTKNGRVEEPKGHDLIRVMANLETLCRDARDGDHLPSKWFSILETALIQACFHAQNRDQPLVTLSDLQAQLRNHRQEEGALELIDRLEPFVGETYGRWFNGPSQLQLSEEVICFDLKGVQKMPVLVRGMLPLVVNLIYDLVLLNPGRRKLVPFDEMWSYDCSPAFINFFIEMCKTIRKEDGAPIGVSQALADAGMSKQLERALKQNTTTWFLLDQGKPEYRDHAVETLNLSDGEAELLAHMRSSAEGSRKGEVELYREALMVRTLPGGNKSGICRIELMPEQLWLYATDPEEKRMREEAVRQFGGDLWKAIRYLAERHPGGLHLKQRAL